MSEAWEQERNDCLVRLGNVSLLTAQHGRLLNSPLRTLPNNALVGKPQTLALPASAARDCGETETTTTGAAGPPARASASLAMTSAPLCDSSSTVSAEVTQPLQARQSCRVTCGQRAQRRGPPLKL